jgi:integrase
VRHRLGTDKKAAEEQFAFLLRKADLGESADHNPRFSVLADMWLEHTREEYSAERYRLCKGRLKSFVAFLGRETKVKAMRGKQIEEWVGTLEGVKSAGTRTLYKGMPVAVLNWAVKSKLIARNPIRGEVTFEEGGSRGKECVDAWSREVFTKVLEVGNPAFADLVRMLAYTGARPSTVRQIEAKHWNPVTSTFDVECLYRDRKSKVKYVERVWVTLPDGKELVQRKLREHPTGTLLRNTFGEPWSETAPTVYLYQLRNRFQKSAGFAWPEGLCLYGLRHLFAAKFIEHRKGENLELLRVILGHENLKMIRKHYGHLFDQHKAIHETVAGMKLF